MVAMLCYGRAYYDGWSILVFPCDPDRGSISGHRCFSCCGQTDGLHYDGENSAVEPTIGHNKRWQFQNGRFKGVLFAVVARPCTMHGRCFAIVYADRPMADWC